MPAKWHGQQVALKSFGGCRFYPVPCVRPVRSDPGGAYASDVACSQGRPPMWAEIDILCDPQTSGGLLIAVPQDKADALLGAMQRHHVPAAVIGHVVRGTAGSIRVTL